MRKNCTPGSVPGRSGNWPSYGYGEVLERSFEQTAPSIRPQAFKGRSMPGVISWSAVPVRRLASSRSLELEMRAGRRDLAWRG